MTKIKNTKKGMAKKTLSMSLVVAMLATSNVPVWAAEFSDGSDVAVTSEAAAPVAEDTEAFSDETVDAPVVDDAAEEVSTAQVADGYTVNTNMELKSDDWAKALNFAKKDGVTEDAKFEVLDKNTVATTVSKVEVYSGDSLIGEPTKVNGKSVNDVVNAIAAATTNGVGLAAYKNSKQVTVKFYVTTVDGKEVPVYETSTTVKPVDISKKGWTVSTAAAADYNGKIQTPVVTVENNAYSEKADVVVKFDDEKDAKNADDYTFSVEGVEASGYTGTIGNQTYKINTIKPAKDNVSVVISGTATYTDGKIEPTVVVTDKLTNTVIPSSLYTVKVKNAAPGTYDKTNIIVTMKADNEKTGKEQIKNNFTAKEVIPADCFTGNFVVSALDLSKLGEKYDISVASKTVKADVEKKDITFVDKATKKVVAYDDVIPATTLSKNDKVDSTTIITSNNTAVGTGKVTIKATNAKETEIVGEYNTTFNVVNATIDASMLSFPKGTKVGTTTLDAKTDLTDAKIYKTNGNTKVLKDQIYTGSAIEPYKEAFSNLVLKNSATVTDQKLVLGTDYDLVYENNTDSTAVSKKTPTVKLVFKGNYSGTVDFTFDIAKATAKVEAAALEYVPGKNTYDIAAKVTVDGKDVPTSAYTVTTTQKATSVVSNTNVAKGVVVFENKNYVITVNNTVPTKKVTNLADVDENGGVTEDGRYCVMIKAALTGRKLSNCTASVEGNYVYTGEAISPKLVVKDGTTTLVEGVDYTIINKTGTNAGAAHVTIKGKGNYQGTLTVDYTIAKANLANATVLSSAKAGSGNEKKYDVSYSGVAVKPDIAKVKIGSKELTAYDPITKKGDYTITYDEAIEVGTYNFTITALAGSQNVEGEYKGTFKVTPHKLSAKFATKVGKAEVADGATLDPKKTGVSYTGSAITIDSFKTKYVLVDKNTNKTLTEGKDYELVYTDNVNAGIATVVAYGLGNYAELDDKGKKQNIASMKFYIEGKDAITDAWVQKISDVEYAGGLPVEPTVVVVNPTTKERLTQGKDYTVTTTVTDIYNPITGKVANRTQADVIIKGLGAYTTTDTTNAALSFNNNKTLNWKVTKKDLANTAVSVDKNSNVTVLNGTVIVPATEYDVKFSDDKKKVTVTAKADNKYYTGSKEITVESAKVGQAMIANVVVKGNTVTPVLSSEVDEAVGYDYVIATEEDYKNGRVGVSKNILKTNTDFHYVQQGTYYAYCHAWKRNAEGKKVFGEWSNIVKFTVTATTPSTPTVKSVKVKGNTVTVTYTVSEDATGYDVVLGSAVKKVNGEKRPVDYGTLVKKNIKGNVVTATFKNVPAGKYYAGVHSFNKTSENGSKVFSKWSNSKAVTVK